MKKTFIVLFFSCTFFLLLLFFSKECISLTLNGLLIWYRNMIPSLFPFMVLSGFIVRSGLSEKIGKLLQPILGIFFPLPSQMLYIIFMGFLCGFPMGAKMIADMMEKEEITPIAGEYLLSFCNNIGPLYMIGYVIPLLNYKNSLIILGFMYSIPIIYGLLLRLLSSKYTSQNFYSQNNISEPIKFTYKKHAASVLPLSACIHSDNNKIFPGYIVCFQQSLSSALEQITLLGGCMIFFNCLLIFPNILYHCLSYTNILSHISLIKAALSSLIEIGGGLHQLSLIFQRADHGNLSVFLPLSLLTFGGLSCIAQTCFLLKNTGLNIGTYIKHKFIQSCIFIILLFIF